MTDAVEEIKRKIDIVEYIGQFITLKKAGRNFQALCPFHSEKSPSFTVSPERQLWHCFGACNEGGDVISFVKKWENCSFGEALQILAPLANVTLDEGSIDDHAYQERQTLLHVTTLAADFFRYIFTKHHIGEHARTYVTDRHVTASTAELFRIGYAPDSWDSLVHFLRSKKIPDAHMVTTGLVSAGKRGTLFDRFRGRIVFPLTDMRSSVLGFSGRILKNSDKEAKYINTIETPLYHKREMLFGIDKAKQAIREKQEVILMEGEFDVILAHQFGYTQSVGIKGTAFTTEQITLLKRLTHTIIFCLDMDKAGTEAIKRGIERSQEHDLSLYVMRLEGGKDPADLLTSDPGAFKRAYKEKVSIYDFLLETSLRRHDIETVYGKKAAIDELASVIDSISNPVVREFFIKKVTQATTTDRSTLLETVRLQKRKLHKKMPLTISAKPKDPLLDEYCIALIVQSKQPARMVKLALEVLDPVSLTTPAVMELVKNLQQYLSGHTTLPAGDAYIEHSLRPLFNRSFLVRVPGKDEEKELRRNALLLKKQAIKRTMKQSPASSRIHDLIIALGHIEKELSIV